MKRVLFLLLDLLAFSAAGGAYAVYDFSRRKLGMQRWVNYQTMRLQKLFPLEPIKIAVCILMILCLLALFFLFFRSWKQKKAQKQKKIQKIRDCRRLAAADVIMLLFSTISGAVFLFLASAFSVRELSSYYFILLLTGVAFLCAGVRNFLAVKNFSR